MLRVVGEKDNMFEVLNEEGGTVKLLTATALVYGLSKGFPISGCEYGPQGLIVEYDDVRHDVLIEVYLPIPEFNVREKSGRYRFEVSNLGHIRINEGVDALGRRRKSRVITPNKRADGDCRLVHLTIDGVSKSFTLRQLIGKVFLQRDEDSSIVVRKNQDLDDDTAWNLVWISRQEYQRRLSEIRMMSVRQYTMKGEFVKEWPSIKDAASQFPNCPISSISNACKRREYYNSSYGFVWRFVDDDEFQKGTVKIEFEVPQYGRKKKVHQFTLDGEFVAEHESILAASKAVGGDKRSIRLCCRGEKGAKTCKGFIWRFA